MVFIMNLLHVHLNEIHLWLHKLSSQCGQRGVEPTTNTLVFNLLAFHLVHSFWIVCILLVSKSVLFHLEIDACADKVHCYNEIWRLVHSCFAVSYTQTTFLSCVTSIFNGHRSERSKFTQCSTGGGCTCLKGTCKVCQHYRAAWMFFSANVTAERLF